MTTPADKPWGQCGGVWMNNAGVYEQHRREALVRAAEFEAKGNEPTAQHWRDVADMWKRERDEAHRIGLDRQRRKARALRRGT